MDNDNHDIDGFTEDDEQIMKDLEEELRFFADSEREEKLRTPVPPTIVDNMERVYDIVEHTKLDNSFSSLVKPFTDFLMQKLSIDFGEAVFLSLLANVNDNDFTSIDKICMECDVKKLRFMTLCNNFLSLKRRNIIRTTNRFDGELFKIPTNVMNDFAQNKSMDPMQRSGLNADQFFDMLNAILSNDCSHDAYALQEEIQKLVKENMHLDFCKNLPECITYTTSSEYILFFLMCERLVCEDDDNICESDWCDCMSRKDSKGLARSLRNESTILIAEKVIEESPHSGFRGEGYYRITTDMKELLFNGLGIEIQSETKFRDLTRYDEMKEKKLFFNASDDEQISHLRRLLMPERFREVTKRMDDMGMRKGFCCLFHGAPGTGKTEVVRQIARETQRDLYIIDVSKIKNCFVGESEKNITEAFHRYKVLCRQCKNEPILLFNEADAVLGIRQEGATRAVDKMENSIQNIILQEMENLNGIMIATTNLTRNLDRAFERRFIYKIEFHRPDASVRTDIWRSMIPELSTEDASTLARHSDMSGGEIENIVRKRAVKSLLDGTTPSLHEIIRMCDQERLGESRKGIGFRE